MEGLFFCMYMSLKKQFIFCALLLASLASCFFIYQAGFDGIFLVDDNANLAELNRNGGVTSFENARYFVFSNTSGMLGRPISMLSFLIEDQYYPGSVASYRYTNVLIHLLCGLVFLLFSYKLLRQLSVGENAAWAIAFVASTWWLFAPIHVSTALYPIQRMTQLSTLFTLIGLMCYLKGRALLVVSPGRGYIWLVGGLYGFGALAVFSKENGALIFIYAAACEMAILSARGTFSDRWVKVSIGFPLLVGALFSIREFGKWVAGYDIRLFSFSERLLTEAVILVDYLARILFSITGKMGLIQDDYPISTGFFTPWYTGLAIVFHLILLVGAWQLRKKIPIFFLGVFWFYGGHLLESTVIPLELYFEHRNYMPSMSVVLASVYFLAVVPGLITAKRFALALLILVAIIGCNQRAEIWGDPQALFTKWANEHPESLRAQTIYIKLLARSGAYADAYQHLLRSIDNWPNAVHLDLIAVNLACSKVMTYSPPPDYIIQKMMVSEYSSQQLTEIENLVDAAKASRCNEITDPLVLPLLRAVVDKKSYPNRAKASVAFMGAELSIKKRDLNQSIFWLEEAYKYHRDSIPLYMKSRALASAGLMGEAMLEINRAIEHEENQVVIKRKNTKEYKEFRNLLVSYIEREAR